MPSNESPESCCFDALSSTVRRRRVRRSVRGERVRWRSMARSAHQVEGRDVRVTGPYRSAPEPTDLSVGGDDDLVVMAAPDDRLDV